MSKFNRGGGNNRRFGNRNVGRPMMHKVTCSKCSRDCEVPFRPTGSRPVFCNECFEKHGDRDTGKFASNNFSRSGLGDRRRFEAVCGKCGNKCQVPFQPNPNKPVFCNTCFVKGDKKGNKSPDQFKQQFEILNDKLDRILKALAPTENKKSKKKATKIKSTVKKAKK